MLVGQPAPVPRTRQPPNSFVDFLDHCANGQNYVTGKKGAPLDFISFHAKGKAIRLMVTSNWMSARTCETSTRDSQSSRSFPRCANYQSFSANQIPRVCAACDAISHPQNTYRLTSQYASYQAELLSGTIALAQRHHIKVEGTIAWAFTFPGQPIFAGLRAFTTNDIDLPLLNAYRLFGQMKGERIFAESTGRLISIDILHSSVRAKSDVNVIATRDSHRVNVLLWNYHDDSSRAPPAEIRL